MSEEEKSESEGEEHGGKKHKGKKILLLLIVLLVILIGAGVGLYFSGMLTGGDEAATTEEAAKPEDAEHKEEAKEEESGHGEKSEEGGHGGGEKSEGGHGGGGGKEAPKANITAVPGGPVFYELPQFLVNLNPGEKKVSFLKMTVTLEVESVEDAEKIQAFQPRVLDSFNTYLRELRPADLTGSSGLFKLREELLLRINQNVNPVKVNDILFKEILIQ